MFIVFDWILMSFLTGLFLIIYFTDIRVKSMQAYSNLRINEHLEYLIDGLLYGGLFLVFNIMFQEISFSVHMYLVAGITLTLTKDYRVSLIGLFIPLIFVLSTEDITGMTYISIALVYGFILTQIIISHFVDFPLERQISLSILFGATLILMILFSILWGDPARGFSVILLPITLIIYSYLIISYSIRTSESANALYKAINFTFSNYYRNTMKERVILERVSSQKHTCGFYCLINVEISDVETKQHNNEIFESVLVDLEKIVPRSALLFKSNENYGFFLPMAKIENLTAMINGNHNLTRTNIDPLLLIQRILEAVPPSYRTTTSSVNKVKVNAGVSIYGIQNQSISELDTMAEYALKVSNTKRGNIVTLFEPKSYRKRINDSEKLKMLNSRIGLDNFDIDYQQIYSTETRKSRYVLAKQRLISDTMAITSIDDFKRFHKITPTFDRFFAANAIQNYGKYKDAPLIIRYSPIILDSSFNIHEFIVFIDRQGLLPNELIIEFVDADFRSLENIKSLIDNVQRLKEYGIKFSILVTSPDRASMIRKINPTILLFRELELFNEVKHLFPDTEKVLLKVDNDSQFDDAIESGVDLFGGTLIETNT